MIRWCRIQHKLQKTAIAATSRSKNLTTSSRILAVPTSGTFDLKTPRSHSLIDYQLKGQSPTSYFSLFHPCCDVLCSNEGISTSKDFTRRYFYRRGFFYVSHFRNQNEQQQLQQKRHKSFASSSTFYPTPELLLTSLDGVASSGNSRNISNQEPSTESPDSSVIDGIFSSNSNIRNDKNDNTSLMDLISNINEATQYKRRKVRKQMKSKNFRKKEDVDFCRNTAERYEKILDVLCSDCKDFSKQYGNEFEKVIMSSDVIAKMFKVLLRCRYHPSLLSEKVRLWEKMIGKYNETHTKGSRVKLSDFLSLRLLEANAKSGNIGRVIALLQYRCEHQYKACRDEYIFALRAISAAANSSQLLHPTRNVYFHDDKNKKYIHTADSAKDLMHIDDPTRWLDAILYNMSERKYQITTDVLAPMLETYTATGRTSKSIHYFWKVKKHILSEQEISSIPAHILRHMPKDDSGLSNRIVKIRIFMNKKLPPNTKIPSSSFSEINSTGFDNRGSGITATNTFGIASQNAYSNNPQLDREMDPNFSVPVTAAFSFIDSLKYGIYNHQPIRCDLLCYNKLLKICIYHGCIHRAIQLLENIMPQNNIQPNKRSYDTILAGLSSIGDIYSMKKYYFKMVQDHNIGCRPSHNTIKCLVNGYLNYGDVHEAITCVQDNFNQYNVLPPIETHYKILELSLGRDMLFEAKRHVYFIQQLHKWEPPVSDDVTPQFAHFMTTYKNNPKISKESLQKLFAYFGEELKDSDFF